MEQTTRQEQVNAVHLRCDVDLQQVRESVDEIERLVSDEEILSETTVGRQGEGVDRLSLPEFEKEQSSSTLEHVRKPHLIPPLAHPEAAVGFTRMEVRKMMSEENLPSDFYKNQSAILLPPLEGVDFVLKLSLIRLASEKPFCGQYEENPFYHIESFDLLIDSIKKNGVTEDWLSCKLFPYTLRRDGAKWLRNLPAGSLTSWKDVRGKFLNHFYTEEMTEIVRAKIFGFKQGECETFREAWERLNELTRSCPHHGFTLERIVIMFYRGLKWDFKRALDAINGGNFMEQYPEDGIEMIKKFSRSTSANCLDTARSTSSSREQAQFVAEMNEIREMITSVNANAVSTRSGEQLKPVARSNKELDDALELEELEEDEASPEDLSTDRAEKSADRLLNPSEEKSSRDLVDRQAPTVDRQNLCDEGGAEKPKSSEKVFPPTPPYPRKSKRTKKDIEDAKCKSEYGLNPTVDRLSTSEDEISISEPLKRSKLRLVVDKAFDYEDMVVPPELIEISMKETTHGSCYKQKAPNTTLQPLPQEMRFSTHELNSKPSTLVAYVEGVLSIVGLLALIFLAYLSMISRASFGVLDMPFPRVHPGEVLTIPIAAYLLDPAVTYAVYSKGPRPP